MSKTKSSIFSSWIFDSYCCSPQGLALYRIFSALFLLFFMLPSQGTYHFLSSLPSGFFSPPPGPMMLFNGFPSTWTSSILHGLLIVFLLLLLVGFGTKIVSLTTGCLLLVIKGFIYSTGKVNHDLMLAIVPLLMAFSGWGRAYSIDYYRNMKARFTGEVWTLCLLALILGFMMFTAGLPKILGGWLNIYTHAVQGHFYNQYFMHGRQDLLAPFMLHLPGWVWELFDYATILLEVGFLFAVLRARSMRLFICLAVCFHFCTMLILNIAFLPNFLAYAAFLNWSWIDTKLRDYQNWMPTAAVAGGMVLLYGLILFLDDFTNFQSGLTMADVCLVSFALPIAFYGIYHIITEPLRGKIKKKKYPKAESPA